VNWSEAKSRCEAGDWGWIDMIWTEKRERGEKRREEKKKK
jgi:hypothetical protein